MSWNSINVRFLRRRMGWSHSDLARRLGIQSQIVRAWESGDALPKESEIQALEILSQQADAQSEEMVRVPVAETYILENSLVQVDLGSLKH